MSAAPATAEHHLRSLRAADASAILDAFASAPDMARQGDVTDLTGAREHIAWLTAPGRRGMAVCTADDLAVGFVGITVDEAHRSGWVFYALHAAHRGRGVMAAAAATVCDLALLPHADGGWGLERLELGHRVNNPASGGVAHAASFVLEGREREKFLIDGERIDVLTYGRLRSDPVHAGARLPLR